MALPNPYTPGQTPRVLAGREREQDRIRGQLSRVAAFGELGGPLLVFHAPRGVGKTSLLRDGQRDAHEHGFVTAWVSCTRSEPFLPELVNRVGHALDRAEAIPDRERTRWRGRLERIGLEVGLPGVKVRADLGPETERDAPAPSAPIAAVEDLLHEASNHVRAHGGAGLVVFVDELHAPGRTDTAVFLNALQNLDGNRTENPVAMIGAGLPSTPESLTRAATFGERSSFVELSLLDDAAAAKALMEPAQRLGVTWAPEAVAAVEEQARGYPYFLQLLAHATWEAARPEQGSRIGQAEVRAGLPGAEDQLRAMYRARWRSATRGEQHVMTAMAATGTGAVSRSDIATRMGLDSRALSVPRERLIDKGIIEPAGHGLLRFTLPGFADYVRDIDDPDAP